MPPSSAPRIRRDIGRRVRELRIDAGLTQEEAAQKANCEYKYWQKIERGIVNLRLDSLIKIAAAFRTSFWKLMTPPKGRPPKRRPGRPVVTPSPKRPRSKNA